MVARDNIWESQTLYYIWVANPSKHKKCRVTTVKSPEVKFILATSSLRKQNIFYSDGGPVILGKRSAEPDLCWL